MGPLPLQIGRDAISKVRRLKCAFVSSPPSVPEVKNAWSFTYIASNVFMISLVGR
jgi:hypothetical protein